MIKLTMLDFTNGFRKIEVFRDEDALRAFLLDRHIGIIQPNQDVPRMLSLINQLTDSDYSVESVEPTPLPDGYETMDQGEDPWPRAADMDEDVHREGKK